MSKRIINLKSDKTEKESLLASLPNIRSADGLHTSKKQVLQFNYPFYFDRMPHITHMVVISKLI